MKEGVDYSVVRDGTSRLVVAEALRAVLAEKVGRELPVERTLRGEELAHLPEDERPAWRALWTKIGDALKR